MIVNLLKNIKQKKIILGSSSKSRKSCLEMLNLDFTIKKSDFEENLKKSDYKTAEDYCLETCKNKMLDLSQKLKNENYDILITADTIVKNIKGEILEKPISLEEHKKFLKSYSNSQIELITSMVLSIKTKKGYVLDSSIQKATVYYEEIKDEFVDLFIEREPDSRNCSGGFKIEGLLKIVINRIEGDPETVRGLSTKTMFERWAKILEDNN